MNHSRKQMILYSLSNLIAGFGTQTYAFAISFYILQTTGSAFSFALQLVFNIVPRVIAGPFIGVLVDRFSKRKLIIISQILSLLVVFALVVYLYLFGISILAIYIATAALSVTASFTSIAFSAAITELFVEEHIQRATSLNQMAISSAAIASPIFGGMIYGLLPLYGILFIFVVLFFFAVLCNSFLVFEPKQEAGNREQEISMLQNIKIGFQYTKNHAFALRILIVALFLNFIFAAYEIGYSYTLIHTFEMPATSFGFTESGFAVGMLAASIFFAVIPTVKQPIQLSKLFLVGIGLIMLTIVIPFWFEFTMTMLVVYFFVSMILLGIVLTSGNTMIMTVLQRTIEDEMKGRFFGLLETFAMAISPLSFIIFGFLYDHLDQQPILIAVSIVQIAFVFFSLPKSEVERIDEMVA